MKALLLSALALLVGTQTKPASAPPAPSHDNKITGDYVEVRTASVFAGPCHYNGELVTTGRDAIMAWNVAEGSFNGVNLAGTKLVAVVSADENLSDASAARKSEVMIDSSATNAQVAALTAML